METGWDYQELGPGAHVMEAEGNVYSLKLGSNDAPGYPETYARARVLAALLEVATDCELFPWHHHSEWEARDRNAPALVRRWREKARRR